MMATIIDNTPIKVKNEVDPGTGLFMYREINYFIGSVKGNHIIISFNQWHDANGIRMNEKEMTYYVMDRAEVLDDDGVTVLELATTDFSDWAFKLITAEMVGATLGNNIIIGTIKTELENLPFDFKTGSFV